MEAKNIALTYVGTELQLADPADKANVSGNQPEDLSPVGVDPLSPLYLAVSPEGENLEEASPSPTVFTHSYPLCYCMRGEY